MLILVLFLTHMSLITFANVCFKSSTTGKGWRRFALWQVAGNLTGFMGVLVYTALLTRLPLHIAFPLTQGLAVVGVQLVASVFVFREKITPLRWLGTGFVLSGIILIGLAS